MLNLFIKLNSNVFAFRVKTLGFINQFKLLAYFVCISNAESIFCYFCVEFLAGAVSKLFFKFI